MNHKPDCNVQMNCLVIHPDGICPKVRDCTCQMTKPNNAEEANAIWINYEKGFDNGKIAERNRIVEILEKLPAYTYKNPASKSRIITAITKE